MAALFGMVMASYVRARASGKVDRGTGLLGGLKDHDAVRRLVAALLPAAAPAQWAVIAWGCFRTLRRCSLLHARRAILGDQGRMIARARA